MFNVLNLNEKTDEQLEDLLNEKLEQMNKVSNVTPKHPILNQYKMLIASIQEEIYVRSVFKEVKTGTVLETGPYKKDND